MLGEARFVSLVNNQPAYAKATIQKTIRGYMGSLSLLKKYHTPKAKRPGRLDQGGVCGGSSLGLCGPFRQGTKCNSDHFRASHLNAAKHERTCPLFFDSPFLRAAQAAFDGKPERLGLRVAYDSFPQPLRAKLSGNPFGYKLVRCRVGVHKLKSHASTYIVPHHVP